MRLRQLFLRMLLVLLVALAGIALPDLASGELTVALSPSRVSVDAPVRQGDVVRLPSLTVSNRGDESAQFRVEVRSQPDQSERSPEAEWFAITPQRFELEPGESQIAVVEMVVPRDAPPDNYRAVLAAGTWDPGNGQGGAAVRAAVGAPLLFEVVNGDLNFSIVDFVQEQAPFAFAILGVLGAVVGLDWLRRRYRIGLHVERRQ